MKLQYKARGVIKRCRKALNRGSNLSRTEGGSSLVEFAVVLPLLLLMVLGSSDFGRLAYMYIEVYSAARAGAAYGSQNHITAADNAGMQTAAYNDAADLATGVPTSFTATASHFCVCSNGNSQAGSPQVACATTSCSGSQLIEYVEVDTSANYQPWIPWTGGPSSATVAAKVQLQAGQ
ncbi:MAG TPA: TadE/TadG family type IV pilus assembly protein [Terriglobia bacterium]|nr:TadE/TadG family type IV pilus assembly protein [Terriglobia bacterium]